MTGTAGQSVHPETLVGREPELAVLAGLVEALAAGQGGAALIMGEPGVGKSALARVGLADAAERGCGVVWGAADELGRTFPLLPFLSALGIRSSVADRRRAEIAQLMQADTSIGITGDPVIAAAERLLALVDDLAVRQSLVVVIDDLHWADEASVALWHRLARSVDQLPVLLLGTARPVPVREDLEVVRRSLCRNGTVLQLASLSADAIDSLVATLAGGRPGPRLSALSADAAGNPMYVAELIDSLVRDDALVRRSDGTVEVLGHRRPTSLTRAIADRLGFLSAEVYGLVQTASLLGQRFTAANLALVTGRGVHDLTGPLDEARQASILVDADNELAFRHPLIRACLYDQMSQSVRSAWHGQTARTLADAHAAAMDVASQLIAAINGSGDGDVNNSTIPRIEWLADWLFNDGVALVNHNLPALIPLLRYASITMPATDPRRPVLAVRLATVLLQTGHVDEAKRVVTQALRDTANPDHVVELHMVLTECHFAASSFLDAAEGLTQALALPGLLPHHRTRLAVLKAWMKLADGPDPESERVVWEASTTAGEDRQTLFFALFLCGRSRMVQGDPDEAIKLYEQASAAVEGIAELTDRWLYAQLGRVVAMLWQWRSDDIELAMRSLRQVAERTGNVRRLQHLQSMWFSVLMRIGRWDEAIAEVEALDDVFLQFNESRNIIGEAARLAVHRDDPSAAEAWLAQLVELNRNDQSVMARWISVPNARTLLLEHAGRPSEALAMLADAALHGGRNPVWVCHMLPDLVRLALAQGDGDVAEKATVLAEETAAGGSDPLARVSALHCRGLLNRDAGLLGDTVAAHRVLSGSSLWCSQAIEDLADALAVGGELAQARPLLLEALRNYESLGAQWDVKRVRARFRKYGLRSGVTGPRKRPQTGWDALTPTEVKVAELVATGLSNPQIGEQLFLSRRTVQAHVSHILTKLGAHSRVEIGLLVMRRSADDREAMPDNESPDDRRSVG